MNMVDLITGIALFAVAIYGARTALLRGQRFEDVRAGIGQYAATKGTHSPAYVRVSFVVLAIAALAGAVWSFASAF
jgi:hypothetical protein